MDLLKRQNWWVWLILYLFCDAPCIIVLGALLKVFDKNAWYAKWYIWVISLILIFPLPIMFAAFAIQITCKAAHKLDVKGSQYYLSPYIWIILIIIPIIGWLGFVALDLYIVIAILVNLYKGKGEKYIA